MSARLCEPVVVHCQMDALLFDFAGMALTAKQIARFFIDAVYRCHYWLVTKITLAKK